MRLNSGNLAGGTTVLGAEQWLTLFNPFPGDAVVDLTFFTDTGVEAPGDAQGVVIAGTSRLSIPVHDLVPRRDAVATRVTTRRGRVIAEQVQIKGLRMGKVPAPIIDKLVGRAEGGRMALSVEEEDSGAAIRLSWQGPRAGVGERLGVTA